MSTAVVVCHPAMSFKHHVENPPNVITHLFFKRSNVSLLLILKDVVGLKLFRSGGDGGGGGDDGGGDGGGGGGGGGGWDVCLSFMRSRLLTSCNLFG